MKTFALATAALGLAFTAAPAFAGPADAPAQKINLEGLNLETASGQQMLDKRIERAAKSVCRVNQVRTGTRLRASQARACVAKAKASAKRQVAATAKQQRLGG